MTARPESVTAAESVSRRAEHDARGSVTIMVLLLICVLGGSIAAVLSLQYSGQKVQHEFTGAGHVSLRATTIAGDSAIDEAIAKLRQRSSTAVDGGTGKCSSRAPLDEDDAKQLAAESVDDDEDVVEEAEASPYFITKVKGEDDSRPPMTVLCVTELNSGKPVVNGGVSYGTVLQTLGGTLGKGQSNAVRQDSTAALADPDRVKQLKNPFCDDFSNAVANSNYGCEGGLHIGSNVQSTTVGIVVEGAPTFEGNLIESNSSIVLDHSPTRRLQVVAPATIRARRQCAQYKAGALNNGMPITDGLTGFILTGWSKAHPEATGVPAAKCADDLDGTDDAKAEAFQKSDPMDRFHHELWSSANCGVLPADQAVKFDQECGSIETDLGEPPMPLLEDCKSGLVVFRPGWYKDADSIEDFFDDATCKDALLYFSPTYSGNGPGSAWDGPGVYYMDFSAPAGVAPDPNAVDYTLGPPNTGRLPLGIVGGTPPTDVIGGLDANGYQAWRPVSCDLDEDAPHAAPDCSEAKQPRKRMRFQSIKLDQASVSFGLGTETMPKEMQAAKIDGVPATLTLPNTNDQARVELELPFTRLSTQRDPYSNKPLVNISLSDGLAWNHPDHDPNRDGVAIDVSYKLPSNFPYSKRQLVIHAGGNGTCTLDLPIGTRMYGSTTGPFHVDLTGGCTNAIPTSEGPKPGIKSGPFPAGVGIGASDTDSWTMRQSQSSNAGLNNLKVEIILKATTGNGSQSIPDVQLDGAELYVNYSGPPSPDFPTGCDPVATVPGIQMIFGGRSRLDLNQSGLSTPKSNSGMSFEMCGSPGATTGGSRYGPSLIGLADHEGTSPACSTGTAPTAYQTCGQVGAPWYKDGNDLVDSACDISGGWTTTSTSCAEVKKYASATTATTPLEATSATWTAGNTLQVKYKLPNNVVSAQALIERIQFDIEHAEGANEPDGVQRVDVSLAATSGATWTTHDNTLGGEVKKLLGHGDRYRCGGGVRAFGGDDLATGAGTCPSPGSTERGIPVVSDAAMQRWQYGLYMDTRPGGDPTRVNPQWPFERIPAVTFADASKLSGATLTYTVTSKPGATGLWAKLGKVNLRIVYRPPGTLRPIGGCLTVKPAYNWDGEMIGTDRDWGTKSAGAAIGIASADMYKQGCALIDSSGARIHFSGSVYAPTAALDLTGSDNDTAFNSNALVVRHLTISGWNESVSSTLGSSASLSAGHRQATLYAWRTDTPDGPRLVAEATIDIDDSPQIGRNVFIESWKRYE